MQLRWWVVVAGLALMSCKKQASAPANPPEGSAVTPPGGGNGSMNAPPRGGDQGSMNAPPIGSAKPTTGVTPVLPAGGSPSAALSRDAGAATAATTVPAGTSATLDKGDGGAPVKGQGFGGLGMAGTGVGSGEPGIGGIGIGHIGTGGGNPCGGGGGTVGGYGTIGLGSGGHPVHPAVHVMLKMGTVELTGGSPDEAEMVRRFIRRNQGKLQYCYEKQLLATPALTGTMNLAFTIDAAGTVSTVKGAGFPSPEVTTCVEGYIKTIQFPKPQSTKGTLTVKRYPITFAITK